MYGGVSGGVAIPGTIDSPATTGGAFGNGAGVIGGDPNANAQSPTHYGPNGEILKGGEAARAGINGNLANGANVSSPYRFYQGRWWYPMANNQWMYWNGAAWANFNAGAGVSTADSVSGQYSSGYRGLNNPDTTPNGNANANANANANVNANASINGWYWRDGQWLWFNGTTFTPAPAR